MPPLETEKGVAQSLKKKKERDTKQCLMPPSCKYNSSFFTVIKLHVLCCVVLCKLGLASQSPVLVSF